MTIYLHKTKKLNSLSVIILSIMYALMSYNIVYSQNIMWLEGAIYLPLVILGVENIINSKKYGIYITFLFLVIVSNFYVGYMVGLFSGIYFICKLLIKNNSNTIKDFLIENKDIIITYIKAAIIAIMISMIILLPVLFNLLNSKADIQNSDFSIETYYSPLDAISKIIIGAFDNNQLAFGPPNIYCGSLSLLMALTYFVNKKIEEKEKIVYLLLIGFMVLAFSIVPINLIFHMLQSPVWFPFRYSFLFSFILIILAGKNMENLEGGMDFSNIIKGIGILSIIILILNKLNYTYISNINTILTIIFISITGLTYYYSRNRGEIYKTALLIIVCLEMVLNGYQITKQIGYVERENFITAYNKISKTIQNYKDKKDTFYRIESDVARSINDPMLYNYNGFAHYSSTSGKDNKNFLTNFGIRHNLIPENASTTTLPMSSLLGIKYYITSSQEKNTTRNVQWYQEKENNPNVMILENKYNLNLGFLVNSEVKEAKIESNDPLDNQNELFSKMTGVEERIFEQLNIQENSVLKENENSKQIEIENKNQEELYLVCKIENVPSDSVKVYFDEKPYIVALETNEDSNNVIYIPSNVKNIRVEVDKENFEKLKLELYKFNFDTFEKMYNILKENQLEIQINKNNYIKGKINASKDGVCLSSIISDKGWTVKVDGKKVDKQLIANNLIGIYITKGEHIIEYSYVPTGFIPGVILTILGIIFLSLDQFRRKKWKKLKTK